MTATLNLMESRPPTANSSCSSSSVVVMYGRCRTLERVWFQGERVDSWPTRRSRTFLRKVVYTRSTSDQFALRPMKFEVLVGTASRWFAACSR